MKPRAPRQSTEAELDALETLSESLGGFDTEISLETVEGGLCALAAAPRVPPPEEWLPALFGDAFERCFADPESRAQALAILQARLAVLLDQLNPEALFEDPEALRVNPVLMEWSDEERQRVVHEGVATAEEAQSLQTGAVFAEGFLSAVQALPALWKIPPGDEAEQAFGVAFAQIGALVLPPDGEEFAAHVKEFYPDAAPTRDDLLAEACYSLQDLRMYWVDFAPRPETRRTEPTPGRNDPCPCGSGKKYKKCHGASA